jgi:hypothetical protein
MDMVPEASRPFGDRSARQLHPADSTIGIGGIALSVASSFASKALLVAFELDAYGVDLGPTGPDYEPGGATDWAVNVPGAGSLVQQFLVRANACLGIVITHHRGVVVLQ